MEPITGVRKSMDILKETLPREFETKASVSVTI
jgi:hypothetical protein